MYLEASVRPSVRLSIRLSVCLFVCLFTLSRLNRFRGSALPSAVKSNRSHYQSKVSVYVSVISRHMRISARMRSIGF